MSAFLEIDLIRRLVRETWRERKGYVFRQLRGQAWSVGCRESDGRWWVAHSARIGGPKTFAPISFATQEDARIAAVIAAVLTAKPKD